MYLPTPPNVSQKYLYVKQNKFVLYVLGIFSAVALVVGAFLFSFSFAAYLPFAVFILMYLGFSYWVGVAGGAFNFCRHLEIISTKAHEPTVDVFLPCCGEDIQILKNTYEHVALLEYPKDKIKVYVLDDKGSEQVEQLSSSFGFNYISRPDKGVLKKAGNIRYSFERTTGEYILILDADFAPRPDMFREMLPYFKDDPKVAIVQSPQFFEIVKDAIWIQNGAAYVQELFYRLIQVNRSKWNASICVGTCAVYSRKALEPHGGTAAIAYSEDLHTGFQAVLDGYKIEYIPINLSKGVCPDNLQAFVNQQYRWCTGSLSLLLSKKFWNVRLGAGARICYLSGMLYYVSTAIGVILVPVPSILMTWFFPAGVFWYNTLFAIPSFTYGVCIQAMWSKNEWGFYTLKSRQVSYWTHVVAIYDKLKNQTAEWVATGDLSAKTSKSKTITRVKTLMIFWPSFTCLVYLAGLVFHYKEYGLINSLPALLFTLFYTYVNLRGSTT